MRKHLCREDQRYYKVHKTCKPVEKCLDKRPLSEICAQKCMNILKKKKTVNLVKVLASPRPPKK